MNLPKISVIVPIYNVQQYLEACLDSLVDQTFQSIEIIMINDGSTDKSGEVMHRYADRYANFLAFDKQNGGLGQARNYGMQFARGEYIAFVDSDDIVAFDAYEKMYALAEETHSDIVVGNVMRFNSMKTYPSVLHEKIFTKKKLSTHISRDHELIYDTTAWNKLFRKSFWDENHLVFPEHMLYEDIPVTIPAHYLARAVDVLDDVVYYWRSRDFGDQSITQNRTDIRNLKDRLKAVGMVNDFFTDHHIGGSLLAEKDYKVLNTDLLVYLNKLTEANDQYIDLYFDEVSPYLKKVPEEGFLKLWPIDRMKYYFVKEMDKQKVLALLRLQQSGGVASQKLTRRGSHYYAEYLYHNLVPESLLLIDDNLQVQRKTRTAKWQGHNLNISGYAYIQKINVAHKWDVKMQFALVNEDTGAKIPLKECRLSRNIANTIQHGIWARKKYLPFLFVNNYNWSEIAVSVPFNQAPFGELPYGSYFIEGTIKAGGLTRSFKMGSPVRGENPRPDSMFQSNYVIRVEYGNNWDLHIVKEKIVTIAENINVSGCALQISGRTEDPDRFQGLALKKLKSGSYQHFAGSIKQSAFSGEIPLATFQNDNGYGEWDTFFMSAAGNAKPIYQLKSRETKLDVGFAEIEAKTNQIGHLFIKVRRLGAELVKVDQKGDKIQLTAAVPPSLEDKDIKMRLQFLSSDHHESFFLSLDDAYAKDRFGRSIHCGTLDLKGTIGKELLRHQAFNLFLALGPESSEVFKQHPVYSDDLLQSEVVYDRKVYEFSQDADLSTVMCVSAKWGWIERGRLRRAVLRRLVYPAARLLPIKRKTIVFESYWGKSYECNPRALYEYIDKNYPEYETVWCLNNPLTHVDGHAKIVRRYSLKYDYYLARAKYFVNNVNFPTFYRKRDRAVELQTMHGTPLKTLGLDVPGEIKPGKNMEEYLEKNRRWDYLSVPSDYVAKIAARAFKHRAEIIESGYPRNDKLFFDNRPEKIAGIKKRLGIPVDKKVIFYAPTWRVKNYFKLEIDIPRLREATGGDYVLLVKFHHFVASAVLLDEGEATDFVFNESDYDDIRDLYLIADVLITDYSSVMFDFSILNRPILLFTYDLENYRDNLRGMYFDIIKEAPGPLCMTNDDLIHELQSIGQFRTNYGDRLNAFRAKFNTYDQGNASEQCFNALTGHLEK
ncbi:bifunctional glycosyltransferase/CDP-glycerol:glycerophosphate glycerophosphotransferase [Sporolactobacillus pectinivorans]|uniref:bifunctional glycosyltransferase/CDP-glycerol:glycerophosphate glycerophosphotransferase n=1 Tax=Sporolactobacillus pectinivorans TaxID=1591408 RepID=UPI000C269734|nr:bifunctional glycosyltransferase/CDP-glycerol:glycerophosphate glycerophosphotransferase [Sporolactobacillus pectinivorans]